MPFVTGAGTGNAITWEEDRASAIQLTVPTVATSTGGSAVLPAAVTPDARAAVFQTDWWQDASNGLRVERVRFDQSTPLGSHNVAEFLGWENARLVFDGPAPLLPVELPVKLDRCVEVLLLRRPGVRVSDGKRFAMAMVATYVAEVFDPRVSPPLVGPKYRLAITLAYLFGAPAIDIEPSHAAHAVSIFPTMTVAISADLPNTGPPPSFAADLRMVFAPRLTRADQHRPDPQFQPLAKRDTVVTSMFSDTNDLTRDKPRAPVPLAVPPDPGAPPFWCFLFDYAHTEIRGAFEIDAVVHPRSARNAMPFSVSWPPATTSFIPGMGVSGVLTCIRHEGQGEFDNVHIHPYVGFDDPSGSAATFQSGHAMVEAPTAADEAIHLHWRWGEFVPSTAVDPASDPAKYRGYSNNAAGNQPNVEDGAPLIPANHSLRVRVDASMPGQTTVVYRPRVHGLNNHGTTQFCGHGFSLSYRLNPTGPLLPVTNSDLLGSPSGAYREVCYHGFRWTGGEQRIPEAPTKPGLSKNRIGTGVDQPAFL